jgi:hypothetical protein
MKSLFPFVYHIVNNLLDMVEFLQKLIAYQTSLKCYFIGGLQDLSVTGYHVYSKILIEHVLTFWTQDLPDLRTIDRIIQ